MADVLVLVGTAIYIITLPCVACYYFFELESTRKRPRTLKDRVEAKIKELERELQGSEKQLVNLRLKKLEASKQEASLYDRDIEVSKYNINYCKTGIRLLKGLL